MDLGLLHDLAQPGTTKIVLCSLDGLEINPTGRHSDLQP